jgi:ribosomal protein S18 acetylase RimI-like enzyme
MSEHSPIRIVRQTELLKPSEIDSFNSLLDEGMYWTEQHAESFIQNPNNALFLAYSNTVLVGFASAYRLQRFDQRNAEVLLYEIGVDERHQQKGIGGALVLSIKEWASEVGSDQVWVLTNRSNTAAMALYSSAGGTMESSDEQMFTFVL